MAQTVEIEFRLSAKAPPVQKLITKSRLRLKLQWTDRTKSYQLQELNRINASLAQALRVRVNPEVTARNLFIYDIIQFFSVTNETTKVEWLELEWTFLPKGVQEDGDNELPLSPNSMGAIKQISGLGSLDKTSYFESPPSSKMTLPDLLKICQKSNLNGAEEALRATEESFQPFVLDTVKLYELENSACQWASRLTERSEQKPYSLSSLLPGAMGGEDNIWQTGSDFSRGNVEIMPEVVSNFTVTAGVSFKKVINPENAKPLKRIQFMEIVDAHGFKLDDSSWLGLTSDSSHLFGLPLKRHIRKQPYLFRLQIYSVDRKTPISIGFAVDVQDWFGAGTQDRPGEVASNQLPNHRVRLRILPPAANANWATEPINSIDCRWHLSNAIDRFLRPDCTPPCNPDVGIWDLSRHDRNAIFVIWAQLSLLLETSKLNRDVEDSAVVGECPWEKLNRLQNLLAFAPSVVSAEKNVGLVTGYTNSGRVFLSPWSAPSATFRNKLATAGLGVVEAAVVDRMGVCARNPNTASSSASGFEPGSANSLQQNASELLQLNIYTGEAFRYKIHQAEKIAQLGLDNVYLYDSIGQRIGSSNWIGLEDDKMTIHGILMGNAVQPITYRFRISNSPTDGEGVLFTVYVAGSDPQLPSVYNHRVIMRFGPEAGEQWKGGHSLLDRWRLVAALDTFLRPQCDAGSLCRNNMDVLLLTFNYQANGFTVIWAQKSLLMKGADTALIQLSDSYTQKQLWDKWSQRSKVWSTHKSHRRRSALQNTPSNSEEVRYARSSQLIAGCPERDLIYLERRLLGDTGFGLLPLPELAGHLKASGVGNLREVQVERLGPCQKNLKALPLFIPEPTFGSPASGQQHSHSSGQNVKFAGSVPYTPTKSTDRQRLMLLRTLLPACSAVIIALVAILGFVWHRRHNKTSKQKRVPDTRQEQDISNPETEIMIRKQGKKVEMLMNDYENGTRNNLKRSNAGVVNLPERFDDNLVPPTKPLILSNERPPLKPPEYNLAYSDSPLSSMPQFHNEAPVMPAIFPSSSMGSPLPSHDPPKPFFGMRTNPYLNLPPPIETKPGMPSPSSQIPYAPYKRSVVVRPDMTGKPEVQMSHVDP